MCRAQHQRRADQGSGAGITEILRNRLQLADRAPRHDIGIDAHTPVESAGGGVQRVDV